LGALRRAEPAEELAQEFALRFLQGGFLGADAERGRFRDYVRGVLVHVIADHHRRQKRLPHLVAIPEPVSAEPEQRDRESVESWRAELLDRAWRALASQDEDTGQKFFTVLRYRAEHADMRSAAMAEQLTAILGKPVTAAWVRQIVHRAREQFAKI